MHAVSRRTAALVVAILVALVSACGTTGAKAVAADIELVGGKPTQVQRIEVAGGGTVTLTVKSDKADTVHVHGYDLEFEVAAGGSVTKEFVADQLGTYEIETHTSNQIIAQLVVR